MKKQILFSDFDGTFYVNHRVSEEDREAIRRWREAGNLFALATGRQVTDLQDHLKEENVGYDYLICLNGAEIYDSNGSCLFAKSLDGALLPELFDALLDGKGWANVCMGARIEHIHAPVCPNYDPRYVRYERDRLATFPEFTQLCAGLEDIDASRAARDRVMKVHGDKVNAQVNGHCLDINAAGVTKATGIASLIERINLTEDAVSCVGDNFNDLSMLTAYRGFAVSRAPEEVRAQAGNVVESVAGLIEKLMEN